MKYTPDNSIGKEIDRILAEKADKAERTYELTNEMVYRVLGDLVKEGKITPEIKQEIYNAVHTAIYRAITETL